jgi:hypothetical protein
MRIFKKSVGSKMRNFRTASPRISTWRSIPSDLPPMSAKEIGAIAFEKQ